MNRAAYLLGLVIVLAFYLGACNPAVDAFDYVSTLRPTAEAGQRMVSAGEPVEVTLTSGFELLEQSRIPQRTVKGIRLGACFGTDVTPSNNLNNAGGYCDPNQPDAPPPNWVIIGENFSHVSAIPDLTVKRGQRVSVRHAFSFKLTEPGEVVIVPYVYFTGEGDGPSWVNGVPFNITFE